MTHLVILDIHWLSLTKDEILENYKSDYKSFGIKTEYENDNLLSGNLDLHMSVLKTLNRTQSYLSTQQNCFHQLV